MTTTQSDIDRLKYDLENLGKRYALNVEEASLLAKAFVIYEAAIEKIAEYGRDDSQILAEEAKAAVQELLDKK